MPCTLEGGGCSKGIRAYMGEVSVGATKEEVVGELKGIRG
jgi:hypothetical protein